MLTYKVFRSTGTWDSLCQEVCDFVNSLKRGERLVSISQSEKGANVFDTEGVFIVWYYAE